MTLGIILFILIFAQTYWMQCRVGNQNEDLQDSVEWLSNRGLKALKDNDELLALLRESIPKEGTLELIEWMHEYYTGYRPKDKLEDCFAEGMLNEFYNKRKDK